MVNIVMLIQDNFLSHAEFKKLQSFILSNEFPWFYADSVSLPPGDYEFNDPHSKETDGFYHLLYVQDQESYSVFAKHFEKFFNVLFEEFGYTRDSLLRARLGLKMPKVNHTKENYNLPHVDYHFPHDTAIFYLNDSDGNTRMFNEHELNSPMTNEYTVKDEIEPKENRILLFDGLQYHTASNPINTTRRVVLNINLNPRSSE